MKTNKLLIGVTGIAFAGIATFVGSTVMNGDRSLYRPSNEISAAASEEAQEIRGSAEWFFNIQKNSAGVIDEAAMIATQQEIEAQDMLRQSSPSSVANVTMNEIGPDNIGGRTRAVWIDKNNPQHMLAGGISGGLWVSNDGGANWAQHTQLSSFRNICVSTICSSANGEIYFGTGEGLYYLLGSGAGGFIGGGVWKSSDNGATFSRLATTIPDSNSVSHQWTSVNKMDADPNNPNRIYAATNRGLMMTDDGGATWTNPVVINNNTVQSKTTDVDVASTGAVVAAVGGKPYISPSGNVGTFANTGTTASGFPQGAGRAEFAIAPSNPNYIYVMVAKSSPATLQGIYLSTDAGTTWNTLATGGNPGFEPFGDNGQGDYDNAVAVDPSDPGRAFFGGVELWKWEMVVNNPPAGQLTRVAFEFPASPFNPWYVHSDKHMIIFHPTNANTFYVGTDGGVFKTTNKGSSFIPCNKGYNVTQCYSIGYDHMAPSRRVAVSGNQDNGTTLVDGLGNTPMSAISINGGDGGYTEFSYINPDAVFTTIYYGDLSRSANRGSSSSNFYSTRISNLLPLGPFVTPIELYENKYDLNSSDTIDWVNGKTITTVAIGNGTATTFTGTIAPSQSSATLLLDSIQFVSGTDTFDVDNAGNIQAPASGSVQTNGSFSITFPTAPVNSGPVKVIYNVMFNAGSTLLISSRTHNVPFSYTTPVTINAGDTAHIQDVVQCRLAVGIASTTVSNNQTGGVYMTKAPIDFSTTPEWILIASPKSKPSGFSGTVQTMRWSPDGKHLYVSNASGSIWRISNLHMVRDSAQADMDSVGTTYNSSTPITCTRIGVFGQVVTGIDVDPNSDRIIISTGEYGATTHIYLGSNASTMAASANTANFTAKQGTSASTKLPAMPVYSCSFDKYAPNRVLVGTEYGVYECADINQSSASLVWTPVTSNGFPRVPTLMIRQSRHEPWEVQNAGVFYFGTHGRGMWQDESSFQAPNGIIEPGNNGSSATAKMDVKIYPNPVNDYANVSFNLDKAGDVTLEVYDLQGKRVFTQSYKQLVKGENTIRFQAETLKAGTYLVNITGQKRVGTSRFVKLR